MGATIIHIVLLWVAVFVGLDLAFGGGELTHGLDDALGRIARWLRELIGR